MEYFDLVDENDQVIGVTTKEEAHTKNLLHRVVAIFVFARDGKLYLQEHLGSGGKYDHAVGGHVRQGESYDEAAKREGYEEVQVTDPLTHVSTFHSTEPLRNTNSVHFFAVYEVTPSESWKFVPNEEVENIIPFAMSDIVDMMNTTPEKFTNGFVRTMKEYIRVKNLPLAITL